MAAKPIEDMSDKHSRAEIRSAKALKSLLHKAFVSSSVEKEITAQND